MGGSHETPFKMKGSGHYGLGNSSPAKAKSSPAKQEKFAAEYGTGTDWAHKHKERPAHGNTAAAHNVAGNRAAGRTVKGDYKDE